MAEELQHGMNCDALAHPLDGDCTCGLHYRKEIAGALELIPENLRVQVREGGGSENLAASLAASVAKIVRELLAARDRIDNFLHVQLVNMRADLENGEVMYIAMRDRCARVEREFDNLHEAFARSIEARSKGL